MREGRTGFSEPSKGGIHVSSWKTSAVCPLFDRSEDEAAATDGELT